MVWCGVVWCVMVWQFEKCVFHWTAGAAGRDHFQPDNGSQPAGCEMEKSQVPIVRLLVVTDLDCCDSFPLCGVVWCGVVWCVAVWCGVVWYVRPESHSQLVNGHTMLNTPVLVRSLKLSNIGPGQYLDG